MRAEVLLEDRVLTVYYGSDPPAEVRIPAGSYTLRVRGLDEQAIVFRGLGLARTNRAFEEPLATFCVVQDWHTDVGAPVPPNPRVRGNYNFYPLPAEEPSRNAQVLAGLNALNPDFVVANGDSVHWGKTKSIDKFAALMSGLSCPWYATLGHHETKKLAGARAYLKSAWGAALPGDYTWYWFDHAGVRLVFLDSAYFLDMDGKMYADPPGDWTGLVGMSPEQYEWLAGVLADNYWGPRLPVVVFTHHGIVPYRPLPPPLWILGRYVTGLPCDAVQLLGLLEADPQVRAVFSGHAHFQQVTRRGQILHIQGAATGEGAMTFLRALIYPDRLEVETYQPVRTEHLSNSYKSDTHGGWVIGYPADLTVEVEWE